MTKNNGKKPGKPITDWFSKKPRSSNPSCSATTTTSTPSNSQSKSPSQSRMSTHEAASSMASGRKRKATSQPESTGGTTEPSQRAPKAISTRSVTNAPAPPTPLSPKENLIHSPSPSRLDSRKKLRLLSPDPPPTDCETVPASQSDEIEMVPLRPPQKVDRQAVTQIVSKWREKTAPVAEEGWSEPKSMNFDPEPLPDAMDEDRPSSPLFTPNTSYSLFGTEPDQSSHCASPVQPLTPPMSGPESPTLSSPVIMDSDAKTAKIIAEIRAKALAKVQSSPEEKAIVFREELDDSDSDDDLLLNLSSNKGKEKEKQVVVLSKSKHSPPPVNNRYNLRHPGSRKPSAAGSASPVASTNTASKRSRKASYNPLESLLKEKKKADQAGKGDDALQRAERAVAGRIMRAEMDEEDDDDDMVNNDWLGDENRARKAMQERMDRLESSPERDDFDDNFSLNADVAKRLFDDDERGKAVAEMIATDKKNHEADSKLERQIGHSLWTMASDDNMYVEPELPNMHLGNLQQHPILQSFKAALEQQNVKQANLLLKTGALTSTLLRDNPDVIICLCDLALGSPSNELTRVAFSFLLGSWNGSNAAAPWLPFDPIIDLLAGLGADTQSFGWKSKKVTSPRSVSKAERESCLSRFVQLVTAAARTRKIFAHDASDLLLALCAVSLDPATPLILRAEIMLAVNTVCAAIGEENIISAAQESNICSKILGLTSQLTPVNSAHVVSLFAGGIGRTMRIARWIAYSIIMKRNNVSEHEYSEIPPLKPLLPKICPSGSTADLFKIYPETDYVDMRFHVDILAVALSNIPRYVAVDTRIAAEAKANAIQKGNKSPSKGELPKPLLEKAKCAVEEIHSKIMDTRGAHLDRSRTKAALKSLAMRVHYQRLAAVKSSGPKPKNLTHFFSKKD